MTTGNYWEDNGYTSDTAASEAATPTSSYASEVYVPDTTPAVTATPYVSGIKTTGSPLSTTGSVTVQQTKYAGKAPVLGELPVYTAPAD